MSKNKYISTIRDTKISPTNQGITKTICKFCDRILTKSNCESPMLKDVTNTFKNPPKILEDRSQSDNQIILKDYLFRKSQELRKSLDPVIVELLDKAYKYNIPYINEYSFSSLENKIDEWENLLSQAEELGIAWDESEYDVVGLQQEIEYSERSEYEARGDLYNSYYANVGV